MPTDLKPAYPYLLTDLPLWMYPTLDLWASFPAVWAIHAVIEAVGLQLAHGSHLGTTLTAGDLYNRLESSLGLVGCTRFHEPSRLELQAIRYRSTKLDTGRYESLLVYQIASRY